MQGEALRLAILLFDMRKQRQSRSHLTISGLANKSVSLFVPRPPLTVCLSVRPDMIEVQNLPAKRGSRHVEIVVTCPFSFPLT